jgi:hypothetical protein
MEFTFELENSDLVFEFEPSFFSENFSDRTAVQWKFHNGNHTQLMANVFCSPPASESRPYDLLSTMRLCGGYNEEKL